MDTASSMVNIQQNSSSLLFASFGSHRMPYNTFSATLTARAFSPSRLRYVDDLYWFSIQRINAHVTP
jgi:hypothetical protein